MKKIILLLILPAFLLSSKRDKNPDGTAVTTWTGKIIILWQ